MISVYGPVNNLSYGLVTTNIVHNLMELGQEVQLYPINPHNIECEPQYQHNIQNAISLSQFFIDCPAIKIWHQWEHSVFPKNTKRIGYPIFELDTLTEFERHNLNSLDLLFVCTEWAAKVCRDNNIKTKIEVIPLGVDSNVFRPLPKKSKSKTIFLSIGKWEKRKGHDVLHKIFTSAFTEKDNVELWLLPTNLFNSPEENKFWEFWYSHPKIKILPRQNSQESLNYVINQADFLISPSRAEGWNLPLLEGMACGVPAITTNYSGHTEFCSDKNSLLVDINELEDAEDGKWFKKGGMVNQGKWAKIGESEVEQFINHIRDAHQLKQTNSPLLKGIKEECIRTSQKFSWVNSAMKLISHI